MSWSAKPAKPASRFQWADQLHFDALPTPSSNDPISSSTKPTLPSRSSSISSNHTTIISDSNIQRENQNKATTSDSNSATISSRQSIQKNNPEIQQDILFSSPSPISYATADSFYFDDDTDDEIVSFTRKFDPMKTKMHLQSNGLDSTSSANSSNPQPRPLPTPPNSSKSTAIHQNIQMQDNQTRITFGSSHPMRFQDSSRNSITVSFSSIDIPTEISGIPLDEDYDDEAQQKQTKHENINRVGDTIGIISGQSDLSNKTNRALSHSLQNAPISQSLDEQGYLSTIKSLKDQISRLNSRNKMVLAAYQQIKKNSGYGLTPDVAISAMLRQEPVNIYSIRSYTDKMRMLDLAAACGDPNILTDVIIMVERTLKFPLFVEMISNRPEVFHMFIHILSIRKNWDLVDSLYTMTNQWDKIEMILLRKCFSLKSFKAQYDQMVLTVNFLKSHPSPSSSFNITMLENQINLLQRQKAIDDYDNKVAKAGDETFKRFPRRNLVGKSLAFTLHYCLFYHPWANESKLSSPLNVQKSFQIHDALFYWYALKARCQCRDFQAVRLLPVNHRGGLLSFLNSSIKKSKGGRVEWGVQPVANRNFSSPIGFEPFVHAVCQSKGPIPLAEMFCRKIPNPRDRFRVSMMYGLYQPAIESLVELRDRNALEDFRAEICTQLTPFAAEPLRKQLDHILATNKKLR